MASVGDHIIVQMHSGRIVRAKIVKLAEHTLPLVTWAGLPPFHATAMSYQDVLDIEAGLEVFTTW